MTGGLLFAFKNFRSFVPTFPINLLVVGAGGGGAGGTYYNAGGYGGNAGRGATVYDTSNTIIFNSTYTVTVAAATSFGQQYWNGSSWVTSSGGTGNASSISGTFGVNIGLSAPGGDGTYIVGGGVGGAGLSTTSTTPFVYSDITGTVVAYSGGGSGGTYRTYIGGVGVGASGTQYGQAGGGGNGAGNAFNYTGGGARGGGGAAGVVIMRCLQNAYTSYTATGSPTVTTPTINSIVYSVFSWTTSGSIIFT